jgi:hypothetical protein
MTRRTPLTELEQRRVLRMREDGHTIAATARMTGFSAYAVAKVKSGYIGKVPNDRLRAAFLESGVSAPDVARSLGWRSGRHDADGARVRRTLGINDDICSRTGNRARRRLIDWETASLIAEAIGVAPWSVLDDDLEAAA